MTASFYVFNLYCRKSIQWRVRQPLYQQKMKKQPSKNKNQSKEESQEETLPDEKDYTEQQGNALKFESSVDFFQVQP